MKLADNQSLVKQCLQFIIQLIHNFLKVKYNKFIDTTKSSIIGTNFDSLTDTLCYKAIYLLSYAKSENNPVERTVNAIKNKMAGISPKAMPAI